MVRFSQALISSIIRNLFGTGSFCISWKYDWRAIVCYMCMNVSGTGIIGSLLCIPMAWVLGMQDFFVKPLMIAFIISSFIGVQLVISYL